MADTRLNFLLTGRDQLSRVLDRAGDSAQRLRQRLVTAATQGSGAINHLTRTPTAGCATSRAGSRRRAARSPAAWRR